MLELFAIDEEQIEEDDDDDDDDDAEVKGYIYLYT